MSTIEVMNDLDNLKDTTQVVDVMYIFSAYSRRELEDWVGSFVYCYNLDSHTKAVIEEVKLLILIS